MFGRFGRCVMCVFVLNLGVVVGVLGLMFLGVLGGWGCVGLDDMVFVGLEVVSVE